MALSLRISPSCALNSRKTPFSFSWTSSRRSIGFWNRKFRYNNQITNPLQACLFDEPILKEALKEPVAFVGGMFAGLLRLDLEEDPLKEWVTRTAEASGITEEEIDAEATKTEEEVPEQIEIE